MYPFQSHSDMRKETTPHVKPIVLWQFACGGLDLPKRDYLHLIACTDCETLAHEITDALRDVEKKLTRGDKSISMTS
jgi:hypothetical protein